jgi:uncharacterized RDD family membrane protein YckC
VPGARHLSNTAAMSQLASCTECEQPTPAEWPRCGYCGAQRLLDHRGLIVGYRRYAGFWRRLAAALVDLGLLAAAFGTAYLVLPGSQSAELSVLMILTLLAYPLIVTTWSADTWGKRLLRAHVVDEDGSPIGRGRASAREGVGKVLEVLVAPLALVSLVLMARGRRQAIHDRMAGTVCVRGRPAVLPRRF